MVKKYKGYSSRLRNPGFEEDNNAYPSRDMLLPIHNFFSWISSKLGKNKSVIIGICIGVFIAFFVILIIDFYKVKELAHFQPNVPTKIYDKNGEIISELFRQKREVVPLKKIPPYLVHAFIAIEDNEFYDHYGINVKGIVRAFFINIFSGRIKQGGSTITQQVAKILLTSGERNILRKIKEASIAVMMEMFYSKDEILDLYLNQIFLGHGAYGVESAAMFYFNKHVSQLNLAESAMLATLPSSPNHYSPIRYPERTLERHKIVLAKMVEMGFVKIPEAEKAYLDFWPDYLYYINELPPSITTMSARIDNAPWFTEYIRRTLIKKYGEEKVFAEGLAVYTTLDVNKQMAAQKLLKRALIKQTDISGNLAFKRDDYISENFQYIADGFSLLFDVSSFAKTGNLERNNLNDYLQDKILDGLEILNYVTGEDKLGEALENYRRFSAGGKEFQEVEGCLISIDQRNGYIEALVGGSEFTSINQLNRVMQSMRQPGSAIKPLLYTAAMESKKFTPGTSVLDSPLVYLDSEGGDWIPENYEGSYYGLLRLRKALALSINVISIRIADAIGIETVMKYYARLLKIGGDEAKRRIPRNFSIALGSLEVSPLELARAYAIIANGGKEVIPYSIRYIKDRNGNILENNEADINRSLEEKERNKTIQIINPETAQIMISMLQSVISSGTGSSASIGRPVGGKTGTTNNWKDAWFVGFVPQLTTCIWMGYDKLGLSLGIGQAGGSVVAPVWGDYMREALKNEEVLGFPVFAALSEADICVVSGMVPSSDCKETMSEVFIPGTEPADECNICKEGGYNPMLNQRGPKDNISGDQKESIMKNIKKKKDSGSILKNIGNDLLE